MVFTATLETLMNNRSIFYALTLLGLCILSHSTLAKTTGIVVTGIGGNEEYAEQFLAQGQTVVDALRTISESPDDFVLMQGEQATREKILAEIDKQSQLQSDAFYLIFLGHGTVDATSWRFNLPGTDINTEDLVGSLAQVNAPTQLVLLGTSASGAVLEVLSQPGRYVVTATKSAGELNAVRFPEFFAKALGSSVADVDRLYQLSNASLLRRSKTIGLRTCPFNGRGARALSLSTLRFVKNRQ